MNLALMAALSVAALSLIGALVWGRSGHLAGTHRFIVPGAVGVFLGVVFFELIPETLEASGAWGPVAILTGFLAFYLLSHFLGTFHHHHTDSADACISGGARMLLWGDAVHNFADGIVIATAFMVNPWVGLLTTVGIALHEIPQEIAELGVLIQSGCGRARALAYNFLSAMSVVLGVAVTYVFAGAFGEALFALTGLAAGNLLYIATADLIPELRESHREHFGMTFLATLIGVIAIGSIIMLTHEYVGVEVYEIIELGE